jgi:hypothetical protein
MIKMIFKVNYKVNNEIKTRVFDTSSIDSAIDCMHDQKPNVKIVSVSDMEGNILRTVPVIG